MKCNKILGVSSDIFFYIIPYLRMRSFLLIIQMTYISFITALMFSLHFGNRISKNKSNNMKMKGKCLYVACH